MKERIDIYEKVTNQIIELLEKGIVPWKISWSGGFPKNLISQKEYRGANLWLLSSLNYPQNYFLTFNQSKELGGSVKKGEKSHMVIFWKWLERQNEKTKEIEKTPLLRYYKVFNIQQCTGIPLEKIPQAIEREHTPIEACEKIIAEMRNRPDSLYEARGLGASPPTGCNLTCTSVLSNCNPAISLSPLLLTSPLVKSSDMGWYLLRLSRFQF